MSEIKIIQNGSGQIPLSSGINKNNREGGFNTLLQEAMAMMSEAQKNADNAVKELASGGDVAHAIIMMEKADMSFQLMLEVRNKLLNAYDEVMRMQV
jgi:flagellar hook-basal body complex protein FliE